MKTFFFLAAISGLAYWRYTDVPAIQIKNVDWENQKVTVSVRGSTLVVDAATIFRTNSSLIASIVFNKYAMTASPNQNILAPTVLQIAITEGKTMAGQPVYVDFAMQTVNGQPFEAIK